MASDGGRASAPRTASPAVQQLHPTTTPIDAEVSITSLFPADSPRINGENLEHVNILASVEEALPPILVHRQTMRVIDGMHRLRLALIRGRETIAVMFFDGTAYEAFVQAVEANRMHGLPLTLADREYAAARIISAQPQLSDRWIATTAGLSAGTVAVIRRRVLDGSSETSRVGRDGRVRPLDATAGRRLAGAAIASHPGASLREIARMAGVSPATVRDVRERMRLGQGPVPETGAQAADPPGPESRRAPRSRPGHAGNGDKRDRLTLLRNLQRDPSIRLTESGRNLLHWLEKRITGPANWQDVIESSPPHCKYLVVEIARDCARDWLNFATELENQTRTME